MAIIRRASSLEVVGILNDRSATDSGPEFLRYNLIYGFNGSGKSTLSRLFGCLEHGRQLDEVPDGCKFAIELDDGLVFQSPDALGGLEATVCVFNTDFIKRNLQCDTSQAASIFFALARSKPTRQSSSKRSNPSSKDSKIERQNSNEPLRPAAELLSAHKTERAWTISRALQLANRRYEALQLKNDYDNLVANANDLVSDKVLADLEDVARQT